MPIVVIFASTKFESTKSISLYLPANGKEAVVLFKVRSFKWLSLSDAKITPKVLFFIINLLSSG